MTSEVQSKYNRWMEIKLEDVDLFEELKSISDDISIEERFYKDLEFGTGGLRGVLGAGTNRMNIYTVARATQGYCNYLKQFNHKQSKVAIAYDSRLKSVDFAKAAAGVFAANGIKVYIYSELMPTPALSFAIRYLNCDGGIVVTASHNPSNYNGYKVYGKDGSQITIRVAQEIQEEIRRVDIFTDVVRSDFGLALKDGMIFYIGEETIDAFIKAVSQETLCEWGVGKNLSIVYTPLNGTGRYCVTRVLEENGFMNVRVVKEQEYPDGRFLTCPFPNPEVKEAMALGLEYAKRFHSDLLLATDPDCDRVGIAVRCENNFVLLSANEIGMLLLDYICKRRVSLGSMPEKPLMMKTIVTIDMAERIAESYGVGTVNVLTGFKFIGEQIGKLEKAGEDERFIFGFEESYGYLSGTYVRDKDGVGASLLICEMCAYYKNQGKELIEILNGLYVKYGYCLNTLHCYSFEGIYGINRMNEITDRFRCMVSSMIAGKKVMSVSDYKESVLRYSNGDDEILDLPKANVIKFKLEGNASIVVRPSGTEPKLKLYLSVSAKNKEEAEQLEHEMLKILEREYLKVD